MNMQKDQKQTAETTEILKRGGVGVLPTDTIYGIVGSALNKKTVERIYRLRRRNRKKPMIILIGSLRDLSQFGILPTPKTRAILKKLWPGKISVILPIANKTSQKRFAYLHRGTNTLAFRLPRNKRLRALLEKIGPLVAPSANPDGLPPAKTVSQAKKYFGRRVDAYFGSGKRISPPSTLISIQDGICTVLRKGAVRI